MARTSTSRNSPIQLRVALKALKHLIDNPEDTRQVFVVIRALSGNSLQRGFRRFSQTTNGRQISSRNTDLVDVLKDTVKLRHLSAVSLGRAYYDFITSESLTPDGLVDASEPDDQDQLIQDPGLERYAARLRDQHDLWHVLTGYGRDELGEMCLLAFTYAQTRNRGLGVIALVAAYKLRQSLGAGVFRAAMRAFRAGRRAVWLPAQDWEALLERPVDEIRRQLGIDEPIAYRALISAHANA